MDSFYRQQLVIVLANFASWKLPGFEIDFKRFETFVKALPAAGEADYSLIRDAYDLFLARREDQKSYEKPIEVN
jgi:hypothetical protein